MNLNSFSTPTRREFLFAKFKICTDPILQKMLQCPLFLFDSRYEKMISGMYMGEIVRLVLLKLKKYGLVFGGRGSKDLETMGRFYTKYVSEIERY